MSRIVVYHRDAGAYLSALRVLAPHADARGTSDAQALRQWIADADVLVSHVFPLDVLDAATSLRWIQVTSAGTEFLAPAAARLADVAVTNARGVHAQPIADYVMTAAVMLQSSWPDFVREQAAHRWRRRPVQTLTGTTMGIVGLGSTGQEIARRAVVSGMRVLGVRRSGEPMAGVDAVYPPERLGTFLAQCDFVVLALPATRSTRALLGAAQFRAMKRSAFVINIARGSIVDEPALVHALESGTIAGACLDVFAVEPLPEDSPLWSLRNVIVTPHIAGMRADYEPRLMEIFVDNLARFEAGEPLRNRVDPERDF